MLVFVTRIRRPKKVSRSAGDGTGCLASVGLLQLLLPGFGSEAEDVASGVPADADEHVAEVVVRVDAVEAAGREDRVQDAGPFGSGLATCEEPVLAAEGDAAKLALGRVVVEPQPPVVEE